MKWIALSAFAALLACVPGNGPLMDPGENCQGCHGGEGPLYLGEPVRFTKAWTIAGTVFDPANPANGVEGAQVRITDASGASFFLRTNLAGNFYSRESVAFPLQPCIVRNGKTVCQQSPVTSGACNACHNLSVFNAPEPPLLAP